MKILVNAKWKTQPQSTGVQRYAQGLTDAIQRAGVSIDLACPSSRRMIASTYWEQRVLPELAKDADLLFCPANAAPMSLSPYIRLVVIVHCLRFLSHPEGYSPLFVRWYKHMIPRVIARADRVLTVSQSEYDEIAQKYPEAIGKLGVLPPGLDQAFRPDLQLPDGAPKEHYITCIANATPPKNLATTVRAMEDVQIPLRLAVIGVTDQELDVICPAAIRDRVIALGHIQDQQLIASWVSNAAAHLSPSRYESFGLPCLEAMGSATPVIASDIAAHREVCRDAAIYVDPEDHRAWSRAMTELCLNPNRMDALSKKGLDRSRAFSWERSAEIFQQEISLVMGNAVT